MPAPVDHVLHVVVFLVGFWVTAVTLSAAIRTVILPRAAQVSLTRAVFWSLHLVFGIAAGRAASYERRDRVFALYAPFAMLALLVSWVALVMAGCAGMFWALHEGGIRHSISASGSCLLTLGFVPVHSGPDTALAFTEATIGLVLLALLITYLPSLYSAFSRREQAVAKLQVRAGQPPTGTEMLWRLFTLGRTDVLVESIAVWEDWFVDIEETHSSFPMLVFFRSPEPDQSWVTAAGAVLDAASLVASSLELPRPPQVQLTIRAGFLCLRRIASYYDIEFRTDVQRGDPISITRAEYEASLDRLVEAGAPVRTDRDEAWLDFAGWRVNYDVTLLALATLTQAPYAPWSSDRSLASTPVRPMLRTRR